MSYSTCIKGRGVCDGCMDCQEGSEPKTYVCADCGEKIDEDDGIYEYNGDMLCCYCLLDRFRISA